MEFKKITELKRRQINIEEWNDTEKAYIKTLSIFDRMAYNDCVRNFFDTKKSDRDRGEAGLLAAAIALVDASGNALLDKANLPDPGTIAFDPINRMMSLLYDSELEDESLRKN